MFLHQWHPGDDHCTLARSTFYVEFAVKQENSVSHAGEAKARSPAMPRQVKTGAIVPNRQFKARIEALKKAGKAEEANTTEDRLVKLEAAFEASLITVALRRPGRGEQR